MTKQVIRIRWFRYELPLRRPAPVYGERLQSLVGFLLQVEDDRGALGWGEGLPRASSWEALSEQVRRLRETLPRPAQPLPPSPLSMAWTGALLDLKGKACAPVRVNALLEGSRHEVLEQAALRVAEGYGSLKLKVGSCPYVEDAELVADLRKEVGDEMGLRLDANRAWSFTDAVDFCARVEDQGVEYLEEPLADAAKLAELARATCVPLALDETLREMAPETLPLDAVGALVVKPALEMDRMDLPRQVEAWRGAGKSVTLSSCFESGVGLTALARLVDRFGLADTAHGLDTYRYLARDLLDPPFDAAGGLTRPINSSCGVSKDLLEELP